MPVDAAFQAEADRVIDGRIVQLRELAFEQAAALPETSGDETILGGTRCAVTVFKHHNRPNAVLVTVQVARRGFLGIASYHTERGLVFSREAPVREATELELRNSGG